MIELAASKWKLTLLNTCRKIEDFGFELAVDQPLPDAVRLYDDQFVQIRQRAAAFWRDCQRHFASGADAQLRAMQNRLGVTGNLGAQWLSHGGELLGSCHWLTADKQFGEPNRYDGEKRVRGSTLFKGRGWDNLLVIPYWRLPGRLAGFLFVGRDMDPERDHVYAPVCESSMKEMQNFDAGVAMLSAIFGKPHPVLANNLLVFDDPLLALRLQLRHLRSNAGLLPLVAVYDNHDNMRTRSPIWGLTARDRITFWSQHGATHVIKHAHEARARVSTYTMTSTELQSPAGVLPHHQPHEWLYLIQRAARRWDSAMRLLMHGLSEHEIEELVLDVGLTGPDLREFTEASGEPLRTTLLNIHTARSRARQVRYAQHVVTEEADGWYVRGCRISSAIVRIEQLLQTRAGRNYYRGVILFNGHTVPFTERTDQIKSNLLRWASNYLDMAGHAGMTFVNAWDAKAINIALLFHTPQVITGVDAVGWDPARSQFNFPKFAIQIGGNVLHDYACLFTDKYIPGRELEPPASLSKREIQQLSEMNDETAICWGTAACVAANILAPAVHFDTRGLVLDGAGAQALGAAVATALGCPNYDHIEPMGAARKIARLGDQIGQHHWPFVLRLGRMPDLTDIESWLASDTARQAILNVSWGAARELGIRGWNVLRQERKLGSLQLAPATLARVLPGYLLNLCRRQLFIDNRTGDYTEDVLRDVAEWFDGQCGGNGAAVLRALTILETPVNCPAYRHFMDVVFRFITEGVLRLVRKDFDNEIDGNHVVCTTGDSPTVWVPEKPVVDELERRASVPPTILAVERSLREAGGLISQCTYGDKRGWLVSEPWWSSEYLLWRNKAEQMGEST